MCKQCYAFGVNDVMLRINDVALRAKVSYKPTHGSLSKLAVGFHLNFYPPFGFSLILCQPLFFLFLSLEFGAVFFRLQILRVLISGNRARDEDRRQEIGDDR